MKKTLARNLFVAVGLVALIAAAGISRFNLTGSDISPGANALDVKNISYTVSGEIFTLKDGRAEKERTPGSTSTKSVSIFGEPAYGDLDADGDTDAALVLVNDPGGSGTFYYAVLAMRESETYRATNAMLLGDRIALQTIEIRDSRAVYNYAERRADEPMTALPSINKSVWVHYNANTGEIGEWVKDFEGETDTVLTEAEARAIAERMCIKGGEALAPGFHNTGTRTWWFDANLNATRPGCSPACVVSEDKETAVINWRCTGAKPVPVSCTTEERRAETCAGVYEPVCATVNIQCIKAPCEPIQETFSNACEACRNGLVPSYVPGACSSVKIIQGVTGQILLGPTCPVMRIPPDPQCADRPYATKIQIIAVGSPQSAPYATATSDAEGRYSMVLPPGIYALQPVGGQPLPRCETKEVTIVAGAMTETNLSCDTGIR